MMKKYHISLLIFYYKINQLPFTQDEHYDRISSCSIDEIRRVYDRARWFQILSEIRTGTADPIPVPVSDPRMCVGNR